MYRSTSANAEGVSITDFYITSHEFVDVNVKAKTTYYYSVRQVISEANPLAGQREVLGPESNKVAVTTLDKILGSDDDSNDPDKEKFFILMTIDDPYMNINGFDQEIDPGRGTVPLLLNNRTMVPIRAIVEGMGGDVGWDDATRKITLSYLDSIVTMWLDSDEIVANGDSKTIDVAPRSINERTMVPIRFVVENLGCEIDWLNSTRQIVIVYF